LGHGDRLALLRLRTVDEGSARLSEGPGADLPS
jgi:hypothetical protein